MGGSTERGGVIKKGGGGRASFPGTVIIATNTIRGKTRLKLRGLHAQFGILKKKRDQGRYVMRKEKHFH